MEHAPPSPADQALFQEHIERTNVFSERLREQRCRHTGHFDSGLRTTLAPFEPLFSAWNAEILFVLHIQGALRFNRLKEALDPVSARVLTDKLRHLEAHRFIIRQETEDHTVYTLTPHGETTARLLHPLLYHLRNPPQA